jgi:hypothetical protein
MNGISKGVKVWKSRVKAYPLKLTFLIIFFLFILLTPAYAQQSAFEIRLVQPPALRLKGKLGAHLVVFRPFPTPAAGIPVQVELSVQERGKQLLTSGTTDTYGSFVLTCPAPELNGAAAELLFTLGEPGNSQTFTRKVIILPDSFIGLDTDKPNYQPEEDMQVNISARQLSDGKSLAGVRIKFTLTGELGCLYRKDVTTDELGLAHLTLKWADQPGVYRLTASYAGETVSREVRVGANNGGRKVQEAGRIDNAKLAIKLNARQLDKLTGSITAPAQFIYLDYTQGVMLRGQSLELKEGKADFTVVSSDLVTGNAPWSGSLTAYYWDEQGNLQQKSLLLNFPAKKTLKISLLNLKKAYLPGEQVHLEVLAVNDQAQPQEACLSFSLFRELEQGILKYEPAIRTDKEGKAALDCLMPPDPGEVRLQVKAWGEGWLYGEAEQSLQVFQPLSLELPKPCNLFTAGDAVNFPLKITNGLPKTQKIIINIVEEPWFKLAGSFERKLVLEAGKSALVTYPVKFIKPGNFYITFYVKGEKTETLRQVLNIKPAGALNREVRLDWAENQTKLELPLQPDTSEANAMLTIYSSAFAYLAHTYFSFPSDFYQAYINLYADYLALSRPELKITILNDRLFYDLGNLIKYRKENLVAAAELIKLVSPYLGTELTEPEAKFDKVKLNQPQKFIALEQNPAEIFKLRSYFEAQKLEPFAGKVTLLLNKNKEFIANLSADPAVPVKLFLGELKLDSNTLKFFLPPGQKCWYELTIYSYNPKAVSSKSGIKWEVSYPKRINLNQEFPVEIKISNNSTQNLEGLSLNFPLPAGFSYISPTYDLAPLNLSLTENALSLYLPRLKSKEGIRIKLPFKAAISGIIQSGTPTLTCRSLPEVRLNWAPVKLLIYK